MLGNHLAYAATQGLKIGYKATKLNFYAITFNELTSTYDPDFVVRTKTRVTKSIINNVVI